MDTVPHWVQVHSNTWKLGVAVGPTGQNSFTINPFLEFVPGSPACLVAKRGLEHEFFI